MGAKKRTPLENAALALYYYAAERIRDGLSEAEVEAELVRQGISPQTAHLMMERLSASRDNVTRRYGRRNLLIALAVIGFGILSIAEIIPNGAATPLTRTLGVATCMGGAYWGLRGLAQVLRRTAARPAPLSEETPS